MELYGHTQEVMYWKPRYQQFALFGGHGVISAFGSLYAMWTCSSSSRMWTERQLLQQRASQSKAHSVFLKGRRWIRQHFATLLCIGEALTWKTWWWKSACSYDGVIQQWTARPLHVSWPVLLPSWTAFQRLKFVVFSYCDSFQCMLVDTKAPSSNWVHCTWKAAWEKPQLGQGRLVQCRPWYGRGIGVLAVCRLECSTTAVS